MWPFSQGIGNCHIVSQVRYSGNRLLTEGKQPINFHLVYSIKHFIFHAVFVLPNDDWAVCSPDADVLVHPATDVECDLITEVVLTIKLFWYSHLLVHVAAGAIVRNFVLSKHCLCHLAFV
jgi:hypothetical protein